MEVELDRPDQAPTEALSDHMDLTMMALAPFAVCRSRNGKSRLPLRRLILGLR